MMLLLGPLSTASGDSRTAASRVAAERHQIDRRRPDRAGHGEGGGDVGRFGDGDFGGEGGERHLRSSTAGCRRCAGDGGSW